MRRALGLVATQPQEVKTLAAKTVSGVSFRSERGQAQSPANSMANSRAEQECPPEGRGPTLSRGNPQKQPQGRRTALQAWAPPGWSSHGSEKVPMGSSTEPHQSSRRASEISLICFKKKNTIEMMHFLSRVRRAWKDFHSLPSKHDRAWK